jgi:hypothetical protein
MESWCPSQFFLCARSLAKSAGRLTLARPADVTQVGDALGKSPPRARFAVLRNESRVEGGVGPICLKVKHRFGAWRPQRKKPVMAKDFSVQRRVAPFGRSV